MCSLPDLSEHTDYLAVRTMPLKKDENYMGDIFGGYVLGEMDLAAAIAARRYSHTKVVTVAVDKVVFKNPVHTGDAPRMSLSALSHDRTVTYNWLACPCR